MVFPSVVQPVNTDSYTEIFTDSSDILPENHDLSPCQTGGIPELNSTVRDDEVEPDVGICEYGLAL